MASLIDSIPTFVEAKSLLIAPANPILWLKDPTLLLLAWRLMLERFSNTTLKLIAAPTFAVLFCGTEVTFVDAPIPANILDET
jgi:hypothetical protein